MGLDYVDLFSLHRPDPAPPLEESLGALNLLVRQGKVLYGGVSTYPGARFAEAVRVAERHGFAPLTCAGREVQPPSLPARDGPASSRSRLLHHPGRSLPPPSGCTSRPAQGSAVARTSGAKRVRTADRG